MERKWTPGPWETAIERRDDLGCDHIWIAPKSWQPRVARVVVYQGHETEERANTHLIAAAPDMDDALALADAALVEALSECRDYADTHPFIQQVDAARAAIKAVRSKARGEA